MNERTNLLMTRLRDSCEILDGIDRSIKMIADIMENTDLTPSQARGLMAATGYLVKHREEGEAHVLGAASILGEDEEKTDDVH